MESWRERGFVPDSDDEDGFDSQDTKGLSQNGEDGSGILLAIPVQTQESADLSQKIQERNEVRHGSVQRVEPTQDLHSVPVADNNAAAADDDNDYEDADSVEDDNDTIALVQNNSAGIPSQELWSENTTINQVGVTGSSAKDVVDQEDKISLTPRNLSRLSQSLSEVADATEAKKRDIFDIPSSSPDALHLDHRRWRKQTSLSPVAGDVSQPRIQSDNVPSSPLSSPLSSIEFLLPDSNDQQQDEQPEEALDILPTLSEIPQEILHMRRSLRQRNLIQLHPYLVDYEKYKNQMRAGGVKPVRPAEFPRPTLPSAAQESQSQEYPHDHESPSASQSSNFQFPPSSPPDPEKLFDTGSLTRSPARAGEHHPRRPDSSSANTIATRSPKRRRVSKPVDDNKRPIQRLSYPQVVIHNSSSPAYPTNGSIFDIPSPPRSGSVSSQMTQTSPKFKFPSGFLPPMETPTAGSKQSATNMDHPIILDEPEDVAAPDAWDARSTATVSSPNSDEDEDEREHEVEAVMRRFQTRIKGVLPASWLRLDQQKQKEERLRATQRRHLERLSRTENAKGVAKIITKKADSTTATSARGQLSSLRLLADEDSNEESGEDADKDAAAKVDLLFGLEDSFLDQPGDDIPEDNRIDYMLPSLSRNPPTSQSRKRVKKRRRLESNGIALGGQSKRPRVNRQARLTDPIYGRQTKPERQRSSNIPKLGILDAPDVATRPRDEQPQFLRIAARKARSRMDRGRRSPSRKVFQLSSRLDTEDANVSLREWRGGRLHQTTLSGGIPRQPPKRQPLTNLSTNKRATLDDQKRKEQSGTQAPKARPSTQSRENRTIGNPTPATDVFPLGQSETPNPDANATNPTRSKQPGNKWVVRRNFAITSLTRNGSRPAVPDMVHSNSLSNPSLQRSLALLNKDARHGNIVLDRFFSRPDGPNGSSHGLGYTDLNKDNVKSPNRLPSRPLKKRPPKRIDISASDNQDIIPMLSIDSERSERRKREPVHLDQATEVLTGFQTTYTIDFGITPLHSGIFFHESTFIGSGELYRSLNVTSRDLDKSIGTIQIKIGDRSLRWGSWDDAVSSDFGVAFDKIIAELESSDGSQAKEGVQNISSSGWNIYRSLIKYVSDTLSFIDPIDRTVFVKRGNGLISKVLENPSALFSADLASIGQLTRIASYIAVFAYQLCQISSHSLVDRAVRDETFDLAKQASRQVIDLTSKPLAQADIRRFFADSKLREFREGGIKDDYPVVESFVVVWHIMRSSDRFEGCFESMVAEEYSLLDVQSQNRQNDITCLEDGWYRLFMTLPLQEIDVYGIGQIGLRFQGGNDNWKAVSYLLDPVLDNYDACAATRPISAYKYCRVLFHRCFLLINGWAWRDCKPIMDFLYDFFAKRTLYNLDQEESYKSPSFLDKLDDNPSLEVIPGDPCFHILLKIIASGLRFLSKTYDNKKVRNFAWRLLPNHGRAYPKEQSVHQTDLDALRNHHDLLCTLYSSVPEGCRPRLEAIKNLVQPASSHRETCNISLRSWARLARFKISRNEDASGLVPFADWHCYFVTELLKEHSLARKEVEAQNTEDKKFSHQLVERTIAQNQRQIESLLKTALEGLQGTINLAMTPEHAQMITSTLPINAILGLFNPRVARLNSTVSKALQVIVTYAHKCNSLSIGLAMTKPETENHPAIADEDSQEYGDWGAIEAVYGHQTSPVSPSIEHVEKIFHPAVSRLVSNCFGEDYCPEDAILLSVVDSWAAIAQTLVKYGLRHWDSYLSPYDADSWAALRWTMQTRKFTPQFLARCIEQDSRFVQECKMQILGMWMSSLVERVSMLKYQHRLTEALLNQDPTEPVLQNLPFSRNIMDGRYSISLDDLASRRLSLISCLLSNMRAHIQDLDDTESRELSITRGEYRDLIQRMMSSMKANYQELGSDTASLQGAYVDFVHLIVGFLQQYTRDICPIDPFFTDPSSFPLPSTDPTYIVARLKSYEPKLSSEKATRTLIIFIQGVSERAALDGQQTYLVNQLHSSMMETYEDGNLNQPTLRAVLLQCVFPAYLEVAFNNPAAWVLSQPIIETTSLIFQDLLFNIDTTDLHCIESVSSIIHSILRSSYKALQAILQDTDILKEPTVITTATAFMEMIKSALPIIDYIDRATDTNGEMITQLRAFQRFAIFATTHLQPNQPCLSIIENSVRASSLISPQRTNVPLTSPPHVQEISNSATRELQTYIDESWSRHQNKYYFARRGGQKPQHVEIEASVAAKLENFPEAKFLGTARSFLDSLEALDLFGDSDYSERERSIYACMHALDTEDMIV